MSESSEPKKYPPSSKKIGDLRKKGQFPKTQLANPTIQIIAFTGAIILFLTHWFTDFSDFLYVSLKGGVSYQVSLVLDEIFYSIILFFVLKFLFSMMYWVLLNKSVVNTSEMGIKIEKMNPTTGFKNAYSISALGKSLKVVIELLGLLFILKYAYDVFGMRFGALLFVNNPDYFAARLVELIIYASALFVIYGVVVGTIDFMIETFTFMQKNKMTFTEVKNESKEMEGSPEMKSARRQAMREVMEAPMTKGRTPNFALANPQHILVPICYDRDRDRAPLILRVSTDFVPNRRRSRWMPRGFLWCTMKPWREKCMPSSQRAIAILRRSSTRMLPLSWSSCAGKNRSRRQSPSLNPSQSRSPGPNPSPSLSPNPSPGPSRSLSPDGAVAQDSGIR